MIEADAYDVRLARRAPGLLRAFNDAGVLAAADVHVAARLAELGGEADEAVVLAAALAVRGPRLGHVYVDIADARETTTVEGEEADPVDLSALPWPDAADWVARVAASPLVGGALRLEGSALYLDRYWREEAQTAADLGALAEHAAAPVDGALLREGLDRMFGDDRGQRLAGASAVLRRLAVVAGGPGTGKTTTVARIAALLIEQAAGPPCRSAPRGRAAGRVSRRRGPARSAARRSARPSDRKSVV